MSGLSFPGRTDCSAPAMLRSRRPRALYGAYADALSLLSAPASRVGNVWQTSHSKSPTEKENTMRIHTDSLTISDVYAAAANAGPNVNVEVRQHSPRKPARSINETHTS